MADREVVIKIPEEQYKYILRSDNSAFADLVSKEMMMHIIKNGIPLPKGHGRIADIDGVLEEMKVTRTYDIPFALGRVKPIIEADTEEREGMI